MMKSEEEIVMRFIREFSELKSALAFIELVGGKVFAHYDWDAFKEEIVKSYRVEYVIKD